jgi:hypothetical protein
VTFKELKKRLSVTQNSQSQYRLFEKLYDKPFWIWDMGQHKQADNQSSGYCCFNHIIGLPKKNEIERPIFDYEKIIFGCLIPQSHGSNNSTITNHLWIKKATGLGITEFMLRFMAWLCLKDKMLSGSQMCIVTGPRFDLAIDLIDRMKRLFYDKGLITFDNKETVIDLNGVKIEAFPSHHLDAMRGLQNVSFILLDEADFFPPGQQQDARDVSERYIAKSNPYIVFVSTPNAPDGLFERIEKEPEGTCLYKRLFLDYTYGLNKIYTQKEIERAKESPSFEREYNLKYLGRIGNVFHTKDIEAAIEKGKKYNPDPQPGTQEYFNFNFSSSMIPRAMGIDPAWGSSAFGIVITHLVDGVIQVLYAEEFKRPDYNEMLHTMYGLIRKYNIEKIYIDGANPSFIRSLKLVLDEDPEYDTIARYKSEGWNWENSSCMQVVPVNFHSRHKEMLAHSKLLLEMCQECEYYSTKNIRVLIHCSMSSSLDLDKPCSGDFLC